MGRTSFFLLSVFASVLVCCAKAPEPVQHPSASNAAMVRAISSETVALVAETDDGHVMPFCTGVWVSESFILTAGHCARAMNNGEDARGVLIAYIVQDEVTGNYTTPKVYHGAVVVREDDKHDLALLAAVDVPPKHAVAHIAERAPDPGDRVHCVGQDHGFYWTYVQGFASGRWANLEGTEPKAGPWQQITAPVGHGMSGSGAFDDTGRLVGILSMLAEGAPDIAIYVHLDTVRDFVGQG